MPDIDVQKYIREHYQLIVEVRVTNARWVKIRLWIALQLCRVASWIGGIGLKVNQEIGVVITDTSDKQSKGILPHA